MTALGCICITPAAADCVSPISDAEEPITAALLAVSIDTNVPLACLTSPTQLSKTIFDQLRKLLADSVHASEAQQQAVWSVLSQCRIFESFSGDLISLAGSSKLQLLPNVDWEQQIAELAHLLPMTLVRSQAACAVQQSLLRQSRLEVPLLWDFICDLVLPAMVRHAQSSLEPLMIKALEVIHAYEVHWPRVPKQVFVAGFLVPLYTLLDCSSELMSVLFKSSGVHLLLCLVNNRVCQGEFILADMVCKTTALQATCLLVLCDIERLAEYDSCLVCHLLLSSRVDDHSTHFFAIFFCPVTCLPHAHMLSCRCQARQWTSPVSAANALHKQAMHICPESARACSHRCSIS